MNKVIILASILTTQVYAINQQACSKMLNNGLYKTYKYGGIDQPLTKATKDHGISKASFVTSTEGTTALLDPKYWSNVTTSETQSTSSSGACSAIGFNKLKENRNKYIAQNYNEILKEASRGAGEHLQALAAFSLCDHEAFSRFFKHSKENVSNFIDKTGPEIGTIIDQTIKADNSLEGKCFSYADII